MVLRTDRIELRMPSGAPVPVRIIEAGERAGEIEATFELDPDTWQTVDVLYLLGLEPGARLPGRVSGEQPVQLVVRLAADVASDVADRSDLAGLVAETAATAPEHPLVCTTSWRTLRVTERDDLASELAIPGATVRRGFSTIWGQGGDDLATIRRYFADHGIQVEPVTGRPAVEALGSGANGEWLLRAGTEDGITAVVAALPEPVDIARRLDAMELADRLNAHDHPGSFQVDPHTGIVQFHIAVALDRPLDSADLAPLVAIAVEAMDAAIPAFHAVADAVPVADAIDLVDPVQG